MRLRLARRPEEDLLDGVGLAHARAHDERGDARDVRRRHRRAHEPEVVLLADVLRDRSCAAGRRRACRRRSGRRARCRPAPRCRSRGPSSNRRSSSRRTASRRRRRRPGSGPGSRRGPCPSLPAAATTTTPLSRAYFTALAIVPMAMGPPRLMLMTFAPWSAAQRIDCAMAATEPEPFAESTLSGMIATSGATPATPSLLFVDCAIVPATCVPCPWSSSALALLATKLKPGTKLRLREIADLRDARVDDGHDDALARAELPGVGQADLAQVPLVLEAGIVRARPRAAPRPLPPHSASIESSASALSSSASSGGIVI